MTAIVNRAPSIVNRAPGFVSRLPATLLSLMLSALLAALLASAPQAASAAQSPRDGGETIWQSQSLFGSYLAGRYARGQREMREAAHFYRRALARDPGNTSILKRLFATEVAIGDWPRAEPLAKRILAREPDHRFARILLGLKAFKSGRYGEAEKHLEKTGAGLIGELTSVLARAWVLFAEGRPRAAIERLEKLKRRDVTAFYRAYHRALIADAAGLDEKAEKAFEELFKKEARSVRVALGYARHLASRGQLARARSVLFKHITALGGRHSLVAGLLDELDRGGAIAKLVATPRDGLAEAFYGLGEALTGEGGIDIGTIYLRFALYLKPEFPIAKFSLASVYEVTKKYGDAIALYDEIPPSSPLALDAQIRRALNLNWLKRPDEAVTVLKELLARQKTPPGKPRGGGGADSRASAEDRDGVSAESAASRPSADGGLPLRAPPLLRRGSRGPHVKRLQEALAELGLEIGPIDGVFGLRTEQVVREFQRQRNLPVDGLVGPQTWQELMASAASTAGARPAPIESKRSRILMTLGNILRANKRFAPAAEYYSQAIALIDKPVKRHWNRFYSRGVCYERLKQWDKAEADLKMALKLNPDQPLVLNYLGYSWVDQGRNLEEAMRLIKKAVKARPDDGYIVDSLGWAYYRLGDYAQAVRYLERSVELKPEDPTINDHLGDAYWRVGRRVEARYQWSQALELKPEPHLVEKIKRKLKNGLPDEAKARVVQKAARKSRGRSKPGSIVRKRTAPRRKSPAAPVDPFRR